MTSDSNLKGQNPGQSLVALEYLPQLDERPIVTIRSELLSETRLVLSLAKKYNIPVIEDPVLSRQLYELEEGADLPSRLFRAVAGLFNEIDKIFSVAGGR